MANQRHPDRRRWDHFVNMLKQDEGKTIKHMELEHKKQMKNHHGKDESVSLK